jgi:hypothetical protein
LPVAHRMNAELILERYKCGRNLAKVTMALFKRCSPVKAGHFALKCMR